ncbi:helix-turn-helix domain-containing protein [Leptospira meyeri]|uniref:helix-turn-helix domain-containing protein n=1 Tax=Leptospira meyeri TaxID=29508 RepID=UPI0002BDE1AA|nr:helix-turn-helix transcriptional regulator [Leptospira meyeri]PKA24517.1 XRE family transcriptional regulator [Leptospira sp. mixed culture ATI2-C-A1]EMJ88082.1 DNA-binding helix-turn-helix protein [Leptospira meyeri serovar Semaranga str. Veldrot Semarang 173]MCW7488335.1 helix-turn-helix transcriptional regulator [Leptospira meyeri]PJZ79798.1 XRE family transcriptional regulator [Leptospira meyeri]PJZ95331.1 XRE family transcriptional regulator [Leptospira meyeri]
MEKVNHFRTYREKRKLTRVELSEKLNIPRSAIELLESEDWVRSKFDYVVLVAKELGLSIIDLIKQEFDYDLEKEFFNEEEFEEIVARYANARVTLILSELKLFCRNAKVRLDDFDITELSFSMGNLHKLITLNQKLERNEITSKDALAEFPPKWGKFSNRHK